jgi:hypothetical protein
MKPVRVFAYVLAALIVVALGLFLHYNLPNTQVVQITGTDVKRVDKDTAGSQTRDVRYINAVTRDGKIRVFRNEDTGWGWPPYFKFDSADLTAQAQAILKSTEEPWVRVRYYGWRLNLLSLFPNAVSLKIVDKDYVHAPWFNILFVAFLTVGILGTVVVLRRLLKRWGWT